MRNIPCYLVVLAVTYAATSVSLNAATRTRTATATVTVAALAKLSLSISTLSFPDANPDTSPTIPASAGALTITTKARTTPGSVVSLSVLASDNLRSGTDIIAISNVTWTASGAGFVAGTMSSTTARSVGSWTGSGSHAGTQTYSLTNSWTYATGSYSTTFTYTLTAP
jgi:hypothetical protein